MKLSIDMTIERETKGAIRYQEAPDANGTYAIGTLYIRKAALPRPFPTSITVRISTHEIGHDYPEARDAEQPGSTIPG